MIRADVFSLLSVSMTVQLIDSAEDSEAIKRGIIKFLEQECNERVERMGVFERLRGWNSLLHMKCN